MTRTTVEQVYQYRHYVDAHMQHLLQDDISDEIKNLIPLGITRRVFVSIKNVVGTKCIKLLEALSDQGYQFDYLPVDISQNASDQLGLSLQQHLPQVSVVPKHGDYFDMLGSVKDSHHPKVVLFLGSNIGNMTDDIAKSYL